MASQSYDPQTDQRGCFEARFRPLDAITNPDVDGIAVAVATTVTNFCLLIQITLSSSGIDTEVKAFIFQHYIILLSVLLSFNRQQLSLFDANFALMINSSPLAVHVVLASIRDLLGLKTGLFRKIKSHRRTVRFFGVMLLPLWLGLKLALPLSSRAFIDSGLCSKSASPNFLFELVLPWILPSLEDSRSLCLSIVVQCAIMWCLWIWCGPATNVNFSSTPLSLLPSATWAVMVMLHALVASGTHYVMSYGQLLILCAAVPPVISTAKVAYTSVLGTNFPAPATTTGFSRSTPFLTNYARYPFTGRQGFVGRSSGYPPTRQELLPAPRTQSRDPFRGEEDVQITA